MSGVRVSCRSCLNKIGHRSLRLGVHRGGAGGEAAFRWSWFHWHCVPDSLLREVGSPDNLSNLALLEPQVGGGR